jgi:hypothetical protein
MTAFDYSRPLATANRLIERYGQLGAVKRPGANTGPVYNPIPGAPTVHPARFVVIAFSDREVDGTRILATDKKVLMAPGSLTIAPASTDTLVEADGTTWNIIPPVQTLRPAETTLLYTLQCRK